MRLHMHCTSPILNSSRGNAQGRRRRFMGRTGIFVLTIASAVFVTASAALAQDDEDRAASPSLDELLGLPQSEQDEESRRAEEAAAHEAAEALRRRLEEGRRAMSAFAEAIEQMSISADLLDTRFDTGVGTQRIQEDIIAKLDHMIEQAAQQSSASRSSSRSSSGQPEQNRQPQQQPQPQDQQARAPGERSDSQPGEGDQERELPAMREGDVNTPLAETREEWGALPERIREMLLQGKQERFSSLYEQLTRDYYRRLASD